jgi:hypothetical protein
VRQGGQGFSTTAQTRADHRTQELKGDSKKQSPARQTSGASQKGRAMFLERLALTSEHLAAEETSHAQQTCAEQHE